MNKIEVFKKHRFGKPLYHPICDKSTLLCKMIGRQSFSLKYIDDIRLLGFDVIVKGNQDELLPAMIIVGDI